MLLLPAAEARDRNAAACPLGLQTLISAGAGTHSSSSPGGRNVATRTIAASPRAVRCLASAGGGAAGGFDGGAEGGGCWVSYGWRRLPRRLPPPIPSLRPLARERTADGRLVISREEAVHRVGARKVEDGRRLVLALVDDERDGGAAPPAQRRWSHPLVDQDAGPAAGEEAARAPTASPTSPAVPAEACFEGTTRAASWRGGMRMSLPRMVH
ncbi:hypothetical protein BAE44_0012248 [Dichanthelium oligosanthes]|uniref:Uncharacterized protein n=1 Tax=Dichanthelium oligosanthes TaxID=888268 RepID=A0A1E5VNM6_9POAL|nr:hypothetical protein BAE44_0012248 [Dichanthelium oligosanthes]